jgi:hypothetical protein
MACSYNTIDFGYCVTETQQLGPGKDPSGSDQLYTRVYFSVRTVLTPGVDPALPGETPDACVTRIRHMLTQPRKQLYYDLTSLPGQAGPNPQYNLSLDDANGPWPDEQAIVVRYTTPGTLEIAWACTLCIRDCGSVYTDRPLSLRWSDEVSFDEAFRATYHRTGHLIVSSLSTISVDEYRRNNLAIVCLHLE